MALSLSSTDQVVWKKIKAGKNNVSDPQLKFPCCVGVQRY
jgi:hypothetical protein